MTLFTARGGSREKVAFAAPYPGRILPMDLRTLGGRAHLPEGLVPLRRQGHLHRHRLPEEDRRGAVRRRGFHHAALAGDGLSFVHAGGMLGEMDLAPGETLRVDTGCLVALQPTVSYDVQFVGSVKTRSSEARASSSRPSRGPATSGCSRSAQRLADRIAKAIPGVGRGRKGEGSVLDAFGVGNVIDGD